MKKAITLFLILAVVVLSACSSNTNGSNNAQNSPVQKLSDVQKAPDTQKAPDVQPVSDVQKIVDIQKTENVGKTFTVQGEVINTLQSTTYHISGYKVQDSTGTIDVSSSKVPQLHTTVTVKGTLIQSRFFGLIINATE